MECGASGLMAPALVVVGEEYRPEQERVQVQHLRLVGQIALEKPPPFKPATLKIVLV